MAEGERVQGKRSDMVVHGRAPYNAEPAPAALAGHHLTPVDTFFSRNHGEVPRVEPEAWRLRLAGLVRRPLTLSLVDLRDRFEVRDVDATLQCAGNRRAGLLSVGEIPGEDPWGPAATSTARWTGVRLADVLAEAGPLDDAAHVAFDAPDVDVDVPTRTFGASVPLAKALGGEVLLAWGMNGEPLPPLHGGPVRVVVPGWIGARSVKWVERVTVAAEPSDNYFQATAYRILAAGEQPAPGLGLSLGPVALNSEVLHPAEGATVPAGELEVNGYAFAGDDRTVERVDVSVDGGRTWTAARFTEPASAWTWQLWCATVRLPHGSAEIVVRAWDSTGATQPESPATCWNPKGYANNSWGRVTVHAE